MDTAALRAIGWSNPQQFMVPPTAAANPTPEAQAKIAELQIKKQGADTAQMEAQTHATKAQADIELGVKKFEAETSLGARVAQGDIALRAHAMENEQERDKNTAKIAAAKLLSDRDLSETDQHIKTDDVIAKERIQLVDIAQNLAVHPESAGLVKPLIMPAMNHVLGKQDELDARRRAKDAVNAPGGPVGPKPGLAG